MKQKRLTIAAIICGAVCALCVFAFMGTVQGEANAARAEALARYGGEQIDVCVATRDIAAGERVDASAVETKLWVADLLPEEAYSDSNEIIGRTAASTILKGEVLSAKRFEQAHSILDVPAGKVAVSVPAKTVQAVGGAVQPGMHVDIYATGDTAATALAEGVLVLATSSREGGSIKSDTAWITIALDPEKVQEMVTASSRYDLYFVLPADENVAAPGAPAEAAAGTSAEVASPRVNAPVQPDADTSPADTKPTAGRQTSAPAAEAHGGNAPSGKPQASEADASEDAPSDQETESEDAENTEDQEDEDE